MSADFNLTAGIQILSERIIDVSDIFTGSPVTTQIRYRNFIYTFNTIFFAPYMLAKVNYIHKL